MQTNAEQFAYLVTSLTSLLNQYLEHSDDKEKEPLTYYAMLNILLAVQVLERYAQKDDNAIALLESIKKRHEEVIDKLKC